MLERADRFVLSQTAQAHVAAMYAELGDAKPKSLIEENEKELAGAV